DPCPDEQDYRCWRILRRIGAVGLLWNRGSSAFLGIELTNEQRQEAFARLEEQGRIRPVQVEGIRGPLFMLDEDRPLMEKVLAGTVDTKPRLEFLAPLDPMLWDRKLVEAVWGYQYSWEIYTPAAKRRFGYYVLPMLYGEDLVGRIEAAADRKNQVLLVKNIWFEEGVRRTKRLDHAIEMSIKRLARFNDCKEIQYKEKETI
ncbi:MAG: winged helix DNA-binding domain-containing protein, partial [Clostridiales bacterium]|nr:winged helix DNA-binding domain-containing protein [Clostridiales bacterium]